MMKLDNFVGMMTGHFDNKDQFNKMQTEGKTYPYAEHVNTICNDKINNLLKISKENLLLKRGAGKFQKVFREKTLPTPEEYIYTITKKTKVNHNKRVVEMLHRIVICIITALLLVRLAAHVSFARHGRALAGESPEHAQVVGRI